MSWYEFDSFQFDAETRILRKAGQKVALAPKAADLLLLFLENPAKLFSKNELKRQVWPDDAFVVDNTLFYQVSGVQKALERRPNGERYIETLTKRGYRFVAPVQKCCTDQVGIAASPTTPQLITSESRLNAANPFEAYPSWPGRLSILQRITYSMLGAVVFLALAAMLAYRLAPAPRLSVARYLPLTHDGLEKGEGLVLTDGARVYFEERGPNGTTLAAVAVAGGGTGPVSLPAGDVNIYDLSPLTSEFLAGPLASDQQGRVLWVVPLLGGLPRRIGDLRATDAKWSPNELQIAFGLHKNLYVANADGSERRRIAEISGEVDSPRWSPDGKTLRFSEKRLQNGDIWESIWEVGADGSNLHRLLNGWNNPPHECCGVWTPDGRFFVFQSTREGRTDLWTLSERRGLFRRDSETPVRLSSGLQSYSSPVVSSDGKRIFAVGTEKRGELVRYDSKLREFVPFLGGIAATWVSFSRSGRSVAYINYPDLTVWRANLDGSEKSQITFSPFEADGLSWSPDEEWLLLRGRTPGKPWKIYIIPSGGGEAKALISGETEQGIPTWSPDGKRIAFGDLPPVHGKASGTEAIHILELSDGTESELPGSQGLWTARWSPSGRFLSALTIEGQRLMLYDFDMKKWQSTKAEPVNNPTWSRDGKYIYFDTERNNRTLRRVCVADGHVDQLVNLEAYPNLAWWWSGVTPDNSSLILRNLGSTEIYSLILESR